jgi:hypothetical protein
VKTRVSVWPSLYFGPAIQSIPFLPNYLHLPKAQKPAHSEEFKMKRGIVCFLSVLLFAALPFSAFAGDNGYNVKYDGGSVSEVKAGVGLKMIIDGNQIEFYKGKNEVVDIPASSVTEVSYGQDVHRRVGTAVAVGVFTLGLGALTALSKSKKHFIGLTWASGNTKGGLAMQCDKNDYRGILAGLEGVTGKTAVDTDAMTVKN